MACCIATGHPWFGNAVYRGPVAYLAAEGDEDADNRISAWEHEYNGGRMIEDFLLIPHGIDLRAAATPGLLLSAIRARLSTDPALVVVDTLARNMTGDENSTQDMMSLVRQSDVIWQETSAGVLIVHHTGKSGEAERGSSALRAASNTMLKLVREVETKILTLTCDKQKNGPEFPAWRFVLKEVGASVVLDLAAGFTWVNRLNPIQRRVLDVLGWPLHSDGITANQLHAAMGVRSETERTNAYRALNKLLEQELITKSGGQRSQIFCITAKGRDTLMQLATSQAGG
jgi:hypothetical protein